MSTNRFRLPPLNAIKAFHAAARHGSIRGAADELLVTPQAVSQQIKLLEDTLQVSLFERRGRSIEPTEAAVLLARYVEAGFEELAEGVRRVTTKKYQDRITLNVSPYFATRYLLPRLESFRESVPQSDLRLTTMVETPDFKRDDIDVAVQWGYGGWGDLETELLIKDHKVICCTPELATQIRTPEDLAKQRLLHPVLQNTLWTDILGFLNVKAPGASSELAFHDAATMRRATLSGMGVGLISRVDAHHDIRAGDLVAPLGEGLLLGMPPDQVPGFFLVLPRAHRRVSAVGNFCNWVADQTWEDTSQ
ncbi:LysR substrate-binding domain-containing protein [Ruegeria sp. 2012CJ41-6]|uniref:LysR substrate-binding domain-containing protein n=1 Tax=Ruegeria spongiae TaxID=2942209 RepID=A0ABT0Q5M6_9RHOB|nr:LysR substrate-binding domain-containing protein [Ruegeria spongiae]MCL6284209.1 LysR substrate-binding domain-containing protein [Ruegeria spongiae]